MKKFLIVFRKAPVELQAGALYKKEIEASSPAHARYLLQIDFPYAEIYSVE